MSLFSSDKDKKKVKDKTVPSKDSMPLRDKGETEKPKTYSDKENLSNEEAKSVFAKRINEKIKDVAKLDVEEGMKAAVKREISTEDINLRMQERRKKRLEASEEKLEKDLQDDAEKDLEYIEKANIKTEDFRSKQKAHIEKLQREAKQKEAKQFTKEEKQLKRENLRIFKEKSRIKRKAEKEEKRRNSFIVKYFEDRSHRFALSDQKYDEIEKREKEDEKKAIVVEKEREKENKKKDRADRKKYDEEILDRRNAIIEREQKRARDMANRREERIAETLNRRKKRSEERVFRERQYIEAVAQREAMLRERTEKKLQKKNRKAYYKSLPKEERRAKKEAYNREYQKLRYTELNKIAEIKKANLGLSKEERIAVPAKNPGSYFNRLTHITRVARKRILMSPVKAKHRLINRSATASNRLISMIDFMDRRSDQINDRITSIKSGFAWRYDRLKILSDRNKQFLLGILAGTVIIIILVASFTNFVTGYEYAYNNRTLGIVKNQEDVTLLVDVVNQQLSKEHEALISIDKTQDITFKRVFIINKEVDNQEKVLRRLTYMQDLTAKGYGIFIDETRVGIMSKEEDADRVLNRILNNYLSQSDDIEYESVTFAEKIEIKEIETKLGRLENVDEVVEKILTGGKRTDVHIVEPGETFATIAEKHGLDQQKLRDSNPDVNMKQLEVGQTLYLAETDSMVKVQTVEIAKYIEYTPFVTTYQDDNTIWKGEISNKTTGAEGQRELVAKIVRNNGKEIAKMILEEKVISEPIPALVLVGTKPPPPLKGTGELIYPVSGFKLSSPFGMRWGRMHSGIDLAAPTGTKIRAADGGTIMLAGYNGQLGYCIEIDHGGNRTTVYGHCSKLYVSVGDKVYQGQHIADVGSTGRSTGAHLHFEVRVLGVAKNPISYL